MLFSSVGFGVENRFIDTSYLALETPLFPISVGLRSQALKLRFVSPDSEGRFFRPELTQDHMLALFERQFKAALSQPVYHQCHVGETLSLIYAPFYVKDRIHDGILNKPIGNALESGIPKPSEDDSPKWRLHFLPTLCPDCGWDLKGTRDALILNCTNCDSVWQPKRNRFQKVSYACMPEKGEDIVYLPFWRIKAEVTGMELDTYADMVKIANLPKAVRKEWHAISFRFWCMAFKVSPKMFITLMNKMTLAQPMGKLIQRLPSKPLLPVTLSVDEAVESLKAGLSSFMKPRQVLLPHFPQIRIKALTYLLVYLPFHDRHHEFVQPRFHMAINKNQLAMAKNL
jgi:hypothetical protein